MSSTTKNLKSTLEAISDFLKIKFRDRLKVEFYDPNKKKQTVPAIILDIEQLSEGEDLGDDRFPLECSMIAYCLISADTPDYMLASKDFAREVMQYVRQNNWDLENAAMPEALESEPADFSPLRPGYECWAVTWTQTFYFGDDVWKSDFPTPTTIKYSSVPKIGAAHEADYNEL